MAQAFPIPLDQFFDGLPIKTVTPDLGEAMEHNQTAGGEIVSADLGPRLWKNTFVINPNYHAEIERVKAKLNLLRQAGRSLLVHSTPIVAPRYDPDGLILGASLVTLKNVAPNNRDIELEGLPVDYELGMGDMLSFTYGSNPIRYAMHQIVSDGVADIDGVWRGEVTDFIRPGYALDAVVRLVKPIYKAVVVPGSTEIGEAGDIISNGISFSVVQTLR